VHVCTAILILAPPPLSPPPIETFQFISVGRQNSPTSAITSFVARKSLFSLRYSTWHHDQRKREAPTCSESSKGHRKESVLVSLGPLHCRSGESLLAASPCCPCCNDRQEQHVSGNATELQAALAQSFRALTRDCSKPPAANNLKMHEQNATRLCALTQPPSEET
jgi:hypothetical protein